MIRSATKSAKYSNHNGNGKRYATEMERNVLSHVRQLSADARESMKRRATDLKDSAAEYVSKGRKKARAMRKTVKQQVKQNPKAALCIAAGIGLFVGCCLRRRSK